MMEPIGPQVLVLALHVADGSLSGTAFPEHRAVYSDNNISQGSVTAYLRCDDLASLQNNFAG